MFFASFKLCRIAQSIFQVIVGETTKSAAIPKKGKLSGFLFLNFNKWGKVFKSGPSRMCGR